MEIGQLFSEQLQNAVPSNEPAHHHPDGSCDFFYVVTITAEQCEIDKQLLLNRKATIDADVQAEIEAQTAVIDAKLSKYNP